MKALIPSGGRGTRLRPITYTRAKQLVPVANRPILSYVLEDVARAGITEAVIVVGDTADEIRAYAGDGSGWGLRVTYVEQDEPRGLAHSVLIARDALGDEPFVMYLGDNLLRDGIREVVRAFESDPVAASILVAKVQDPQRFGVVEIEAGRIVRLVEKPAHPMSDLALVGVYLFDARIHDAVRAIVPGARGELEITDAIGWLLDAGAPVRAHEVTGWWKDTGRKEDLLDANRLVLETLTSRIDGDVVACDVRGPVVVEAGATVRGGMLEGPCVIGAGARLTDSYVWPWTSIGPGCVLEDAHVRNTILMDDCEVRHVQTLVDSLLGVGVVVDVAGRAPREVSITVGDHGRVELR